MRIVNPADPVYAPNTYGGPAADPVRKAGENLLFFPDADKAPLS